MKFLKRKKLPKQTKISDKKEVSPKVARTLFLTAVGLMIATVPLAFLMSKNANVNSKQNEQRLIEIQKSLSKTSKETLNETLAQRYLSDFVSVYMNKSTDDNAMLKRENELSTYYVNKIPKEETSVKQELVSSSFFTFVDKGENKLAQYQVTYKVFYPVAKEREVTRKVGKKTVVEKQKYEEQEQKEVTVLLNIPFIQKGNQFKVVSLPYYSTVPSLRAGAMEGRTVNDKNSFDRVDEKEEKMLADFLKQFYDLYCSDDKKQMSYMMNSAEVLGKEYNVVSSEPTFYKDNDKFIIVDTPLVQEEHSGNSHKEYFVLKVIRQDGKFYIEKLSHDLGGIN